MKIKSIVTGIIPAVLAIGIIFVSCQKNVDSRSRQNANLTDVPKLSNIASLQSLTNVVDAQQFTMDVYPESPEAAQILAGSCPPITTYVPDANTYPHTKTVDWGAGCTTVTGITFSGKTITLFTGDMANVGSQATTSYDNFFANGVQFEGVVKIDHNARKNALPGDPQNVYRITHRDRKVTMPNGDFTISNGAKRLEKLDITTPGFPGFPNGWFSVSGSNVVDETKGGVSYQYTAVIDDARPLIYKFCDFIVRGHLTVTFAGGDNDGDTGDVDYGSVTDCDNLGTLSINGGAATPVTLPLTP